MKQLTTKTDTEMAMVVSILISNDVGLKYTTDCAYPVEPDTTVGGGAGIAGVGVAVGLADWVAVA